MSPLQENSRNHLGETNRDEESSLVVSGHKSGNSNSLQFEDAVFGETVEDGPDYRSVGWKGTSAIMMKTQIGLGALSIPAVFNVLGLIPGVIALLVIAIIMTWSNYMVGVFKLRHPEVYTIHDVGGMLFGRFGREFFGLVFALYWIFVAGSGMLSISIGLNSVSNHGTCTAFFVAAATFVGFLLASIPTLGRLIWVAWIGMASIVSAILVLTISVGNQNRPVMAPQSGAWESDFQLIGNPSFREAVTALSSLVFAYSGTPAFFSIISEMREPHYYTRSLMICQSFMTALYISIGVVVYYYCGSFVASPALGSAGILMKRICYGLALPGLVVTTLLVTHINAKYFLVRILRGSKHLNQYTVRHCVTWVGLTASSSLLSYIIASAIPGFSSLLSLIGALFGTLLCFQPMGFMWLYDNWSAGKIARPAKWKFMVCWTVFVLISGTFLMITGTYASIAGIIDNYKADGRSDAWSCADNSNST